jgi:hypothetical protein
VERNAFTWLWDHPVLSNVSEYFSLSLSLPLSLSLLSCGLTTALHYFGCLKLWWGLGMYLSGRALAYHVQGPGFDLRTWMFWSR